MIHLEGVRKAFGSQVVLKDVDFDVKEGETVALLGPSGTGKSVTLKTIIGLIRPDAGTVLVDDQNVWQLDRLGLKQMRQGIGYVFQYGALFDSIDVFENIRLGLTDETQYGDLKFSEDRVIECLRLVNLAPEVAKKMPGELSGGMKKRVGIARAIAGRPKYLLWDEPTSGLDPMNADIIDALITRLDDELGATSVVVTHDVRGAFRVADRVALLMEGEIVLQGTPAEFIASEHPKVRAFLERDRDTSHFAA
jgi:phospholipid/cholesterol/gamma-HCH transport system ATP-binding protein